MGTQTNPPLSYFDLSTGSSNQLAPFADLGWGHPASPLNPGSGVGLHFRPRYDDTPNTSGTERMLTRRMQTDLGNESVWRSLLSYFGLLTSSLSSIQRTYNVNHGVQASTEERESPIARYQRHLLVERHGSPLWSPQPHRRLPLSYRQKGVSVGDVGVITPQGSFDFLFSICLPRGHPSNPEVLPVGFSLVNLLPTDVCELREHDSGSCFLTSSTEKLRGLTFKCNGPEGSILVMPNGAYHEDLLNIQDFKVIASQNAEEWYRFAIGTCGRDIKNGQLRLVTGCDKTNSWGIATHSDLQAPVTLSLPANSRQAPVEYAWDYEGRVEAKAGPKLEESLDSAGNQEYPQNVQNQCTFLRSFILTLAEDVWKTMLSTLTQDLSDNNNSGFNHERRVTIRHDNFGSDSDMSTTHPATVINQMLLSQYPNAKVAISHDNDWCAVIREDETTIPDAPELFGRMRQTFSSHIDDDGTVYLSQNHAPETKPQPQPCSNLTPEHPVCARGISSDGTGNTRNEEEILSGSGTRGKQSEESSNTAFSEEGFVHRLTLEERACSSFPLHVQDTPAASTSRARKLPIGVPERFTNSIVSSPTSSASTVEPLRKKALLIGINYPKDTKWHLRGPQKEVSAFRELLLMQYGYQDANIVVLTDQPGTPPEYLPTRINIVREIMKLTVGSSPGDEHFLLYSGHSAQREEIEKRELPTADITNIAHAASSEEEEEEDRCDEYIIPLDAIGSEMKVVDEKIILDDVLRQWLVLPLCPQAKLVAIFDCCHSVTLLGVYFLVVYLFSVCFPFPWCAFLSGSLFLALTSIHSIFFLFPPAHHHLPHLYLAHVHPTDLEHHRCHRIGPWASRFRRLFRRLIVEPYVRFVLPFKSSTFRKLDPRGRPEDTDPRKRCSGLCARMDLSSLDREHVVCVSACKDSQINVEDKAGESMSQAIIDLLSENPRPTVRELIEAVNANTKLQRKKMKRQYEIYEKEVRGQPFSQEALKAIELGKVLCKNVQKPQISSSRSLDLKKTYLFEPSDVDAPDHGRIQGRKGGQRFRPLLSSFRGGRARS
ncbi:hypothetical protein K443DRAFT_680954 [Laccaria amethystina LaAM-08-1]|uniref:Peptidase C14 caspase domain-containing protein n=1 Tax=Laccaria amethystina LaAM-08-1 TaxID=1095629 RepID=A0A0C9XQ77_9AGAR|nr:hypothetical protein K443DRAFT_680954 [Laccaria amethystina LaAM-08-1]